MWSVIVYPIIDMDPRFKCHNIDNAKGWKIYWPIKEIAPYNPRRHDKEGLQAGNKMIKYCNAFVSFNV